VDSKKIEAIEVVYQGFLKSLLRVWKTTSTSIMASKIWQIPLWTLCMGTSVIVL
jgi:hypothetical protein